MTKGDGTGTDRGVQVCLSIFDKTEYPTLSISSNTARRAKDLPGTALIFNTVWDFAGIPLTQKSRDFGGYCTCQLCTGSELYNDILSSKFRPYMRLTHASDAQNNMLKYVGEAMILLR
jgi:hypothetical protein